MTALPASLVRGATAPLQRAARGALQRAFGPPPFDPERPVGDPGLLGPDAVSWRVIADLASIVGGVRGLLVQLLHPLAMAGVAQHSRYRDDPLGRLQATSAYVTTVAFGPTADGLAVTRRVRAVHTRVHGTTADGRSYRADDPHLLAWVSTALTSSFLAADAAYASAPVGPAEADRFVREQSTAAALLDPRVDLAALGPADLAALRHGELPLPMLADGSLPLDVAALDAAAARFRAELEVGEEGRAARRFLLWPPLPPGLKVPYVPILAGALATLPPDLRRLLRVPPSRAAAAVVRADTRVRLAALRGVTGPSPVLAAVRQRTAGIS